MELREVLFKAAERSELTGKELSERSGVSEAQISRFRKGGDISFKNFQRLVDGLPPHAYHQFACQLLVQRMSNKELSELVIVAVSRMSKEDNEPERVLALNGAASD